MTLASVGPVNVAAAASNVCTATPGVAVLESWKPDGMTSGSVGCVLRRIGGDLSDGADRRARLVAEQRDEAGDAVRELRGAQVALVGDALVVEGEDVGEIGPPLEHLQAEVAGRRAASRAALARPASGRSSARRKPVKSSTR